MNMPNINKFNWVIGKTDKQKYIDYCTKVVRDEEEFKIFRKNDFYRSVIGAPSILQSWKMYLDAIKNPLIVEKMYQYIKSDYVGQPYVYDFGGAFLSTNLIRNLNTVNLLSKYFNDLDNKNILEIGGGCGTLAYCIDITWKVNYYMLDLSAAMNLQHKMCNTLGTDANFTACHDIDLLIAEYSIGELDYDAQKFYFDNYISKAKKIFLRYNCTNKETTDKFIDLLKTKFEITIEEEIGNAVSFNKIITGNKI